MALSIVACSDVAITSRLELEGEPVRVVANAGEHGGISVGVLGEHTLVELAVAHPEADAELRAQWLDASLEPVGDSFGLGMGLNYTSRWVRDGAELVAQIWADPTYTSPPAVQSDAVYFWRLRPPPASGERSRVLLDVTPRSFEGEATVTLGTSIFASGPEAKLPIAVSTTSAVAAGLAAPGRCGLSYNYRLFLGLPDGSSSFVEWDDNLCDGVVNAVLEPSNPWLLDFDDGEVGVLFRLGNVLDGRVHWLRLGASDGAREAPSVVGADEPASSSVDFGRQPRGARVTGDTFLFSERRAATNTCHALRLAHIDGTALGDSAWQLPCVSDGARLVPAVELVRAPGGALLVWTEHSDAVARFITASLPWDEGIYATLIGPDGRRASEIVRVTDEAATALDDVPRTETRGPISRDFRFGVDVEGDRAVIAWYDRRRGAAGVYARVLRIRSLGP